MAYHILISEKYIKIVESILSNGTIIYDTIRKCMLRDSILEGLNIIVSSPPVNRCIIAAKHLDESAKKSKFIKKIVLDNAIMPMLKAEAMEREGSGSPSVILTTSDYK